MFESVDFVHSSLVLTPFCPPRPGHVGVPASRWAGKTTRCRFLRVAFFVELGYFLLVKFVVLVVVLWYALVLR